MSESLIYITCETTEEAENIGAIIVERRLAACVNILSGMQSMYWWEGKVEKADEIVLIAKTRTSLVDELTEAVTAMHSYDVPCVVAMPLIGGNPQFLSWIREETKDG
ncbi:MAG: divalent-cation tolerance protein CutA [Pseudodesulfovibrio sp.]